MNDIVLSGKDYELVGSALTGPLIDISVRGSEFLSIGLIFLPELQLNF